MKNKRILSFVIAVVSLFSCISFTAVASEEPVSVEFFIAQGYSTIEGWPYGSNFTKIGVNFAVLVEISGVDNISECEILFEYNDDVLELDVEHCGINYNSADINYMPLTEKTVSGNQIKVHIYDEKGIAKTDMFKYQFGFKAIGKGSLDIKAEITKLVDGDGKIHKADVNINVPSYTYTEDEIPKALPDFETSLSYGLSKYIDTELAYPMTVAEFSSKMQNAENCEIIIKDRYGELLDADAMIPTGATLSVIFDKMEVFYSTFTCIGDVNCDGRVTSADARQVLRFVSGLDTDAKLRLVLVAAGNTSMDTEKLTSADAREILRHCAGVGETYADWYDYHCALKRTDRFLINDNL